MSNPFSCTHLLSSPVQGSVARAVKMLQRNAVATLTKARSGVPHHTNNLSLAANWKLSWIHTSLSTEGRREPLLHWLGKCIRLGDSLRQHRERALVERNLRPIHSVKMVVQRSCRCTMIPLAAFLAAAPAAPSNGGNPLLPWLRELEMLSSTRRLYVQVYMIG